ncbi:MAG: hypothetical protein U0R17_04380 [Acidimicrobiia bacterium]
MSNPTIDKTNEDMLMAEVEASIIDAEFKVLTQSNEECALTGSGLQVLFNNWSTNK